ncbi:chemotaxis protein CheW [Endothiovibrio diazotrophicus]
MASPRRTRRGRSTAREEEGARAQYLTFALGKETFGVEIARVREILEYEPPTEIPMVPAYIRGVINLRGTAVPVLDLARRMGRGEGRISRRSCIVIVEVGGSSNERPGVAIGVMVDGVQRVLEIPADQIEPRPELGGDIHSDFIHGMARREGGFLVLLNIDYVFSSADIRLLDGLGDESAPTMAEGALP